jgi:succinate dehydrogenase hydrophobic anchor subunit
LIFVILGIHLVVNHLVAPDGLLSYADVIRYYSIPFIPVMEICFLVLAVGHSLMGLRSILLDLNPSDRLLVWADRLLVVIGAVAIIYGVWLVIVLAGRSAGL